MKRIRPTVSRLRRSIIYQPLAVLLPVLLIPALSWVQSGGRANPTGSPFQASAQTSTGSCAGQVPNRIIQTNCFGGVYADDLTQLESDAVNAYIGMHGLSSSDEGVIYNFGRGDLRSAVPASMVSLLIGIIKEPTSQRTTHEQNLYNWFQHLVQQNEIAEYTSAISQFQAWQNDPCKFTLDPTIAKEVGISYNGAPFCGISLSSAFSSPPVPAET